MIVDVRVRPPYKSWLNMFLFRQKEWTRAITEQMGFEPPRSYLESSIEELIRELQGAQIVRAVIPGNHAIKPESAGRTRGGSKDATVDLEVVPNEEIRELVDRYPDVFVGIAAVDPLNDDAPREIRRAVRDWGFRGVAVDPGLATEAMYPDDERLFSVYETCERLEVPVLIKMSHQMGPDISYGHPLYLGRAASAFPRLPMVVVHGAWPYVREVIGVAHRYGNVYLQPDFYMTFPGHLDYVEAVNTFLSDRFLYASGYPVLPVAGMLGRFKKLPFSPAVLPKVLYENAARLFRL